MTETNWKGWRATASEKKPSIEAFMKQHLYSFLFTMAGIALLFCGVLIGETSKISPILHQINDNLTILAKEQKSLAERQQADYDIQYLIHSRLFYRIDSLGEELRMHTMKKHR